MSFLHERTEPGVSRPLQELVIQNAKAVRETTVKQNSLVLTIDHRTSLFYYFSTAGVVHGEPVYHRTG